MDNHNRNTNSIIPQISSIAGIFFFRKLPSDYCFQHLVCLTLTDKNLDDTAGKECLILNIYVTSLLEFYFSCPVFSAQKVETLSLTSGQHFFPFSVSIFSHVERKALDQNDCTPLSIK